MKPALILLTCLFSICLLFQSCVIEENNPPTAAFTVSPNTGNTQTVFVFDASISSDPEDATNQLQVRWDFNGDNISDTEWETNKIQSIQFVDEGTYNVQLEVMDTDGLTGLSPKSLAVSNSGGGNTFSDPRDGKIYPIESIGNQTWISQNINFKTKGGWCYDNDPANCQKYGMLYDWDAAQLVCPTGWHIPSDNEWKQLEMYLGMSQSEADIEYGWRGTDQGTQMKSTTGWPDGGNGTNSSGFNGLPGGLKDNWGDFINIEFYGGWWTSTETGDYHAWMRGLFGKSLDMGKVSRAEGQKVDGRYVRCVKD